MKAIVSMPSFDATWCKMYVLLQSRPIAFIFFQTNGELLLTAIQFHRLTEAAASAPSGDNSQPYCMVADKSTGCIDVCVDVSRDLSPMNSGQRMARIAVGASIENIRFVAELNGWSPDVAPSASKDAIRVRIHVQGRADRNPAIIACRVTNRRLYDARTITTGELVELSAAVPGDHVRPVWIGERDRVNSLASTIGMMDAIMFGIGSVRRAFLENVRFDRPAREEVDLGLSLASLELAPSERFGLGIMGVVSDKLYGILRIGRSLERKAQSLVKSASGVCLIVVSDEAPSTDFDVGRRMQQVWLELTRRGYAVQPMMSLPVLENMVFNRHPCCTRDVIQRTAELGGEMKRIAGVQDHERIAAIMRFGYAPPPSGRTGCRPLESVVRIVNEE